jgi:hypothetical protein
VADRVDAATQAQQPTIREPMVDEVLSRPQLEELPARDDSVLLGSECSDRFFDGI